MTHEENTFAGQLRHFAKSVDIVDDRVFDHVRSLIYRYVRSELDALYFEVDREQDIDGRPGLRMFWSDLDRDHNWPLKSADESYTNCVTRAVALNQPMWIVASDKSGLSEAEKYEDLWSASTDLPRHRPDADQPVKTVVIVPLRRRRMLGAYYFESGKYIGITEVAKQELLQLGDALAILLELYEAHKSQTRLTGEAIDHLQDTLESARFPKLTKPHFFLAFSNAADSSVRLVITETLDKFADQLEFTDWTKMADSGNINEQIAREIVRSRFGICYLSEPSPDDSGHRFVDNPNVVFEAGMLHALTSANTAASGAEPSGWIPMREADSPPAPFDFAAERTIEIPRTGNGEVNEGRLATILEERVSRLLGFVEHDR
jgi:hypothetical protein